MDVVNTVLEIIGAWLLISLAVGFVIGLVRARVRRSRRG